MEHTYRLKVTVGVKKEGITEASDGRLLVSVNAKREKGEANQRVIALLAKHIGVAPSSLVITKGHTSGTKTVALKGVARNA